jgi:hypothetical protein
MENLRFSCRVAGLSSVLLIASTPIWFIALFFFKAGLTDLLTLSPFAVVCIIAVPLLIASQKLGEEITNAEFKTGLMWGMSIIRP